MIKNLKPHILQTFVSEGNMNFDETDFSNTILQQKNKEDFLNRRIILGNRKGFDGKLMFKANQFDKNGSYKEINEEIIELNPNGWADIKEDILIISSKLTGVAIGHPVADNPVLVITDSVKNVTAVAHMGFEQVDMKLPVLTIDALRAAYDSKVSDIYAYITASAGPNLAYEVCPSAINNEKVWYRCVKEKNNLFYIDIKMAIQKQLHQLHIAGYDINNADTITNSNYYSNYAVSKGNVKKKGYNFAGVYYKFRKE